MDPYKHEHTGTIELSWAQLGDILTAMAETIGEEWRPDIVIGIAKGGVVPGIFLSSAFLVDFFPIKLSSRHNEQVVGEEPEWYVRPTEHVKGKKVLLVDDICIARQDIWQGSSGIERDRCRRGQDCGDSCPQRQCPPRFCRNRY